MKAALSCGCGRGGTLLIFTARGALDAWRYRNTKISHKYASSSAYISWLHVRHAPRTNMQLSLTAWAVVAGAVASQSQGPSYGATLQYGYDLINVNEDVVTHVEVMQDASAGKSITVISSPYGNYSSLIRNDLQEVYLYYPYYDGWYCLAGSGQLPISAFSLAGFEYLAPAALGNNPMTHFRGSLGDMYLFGAYLATDSSPILFTSPGNQEQIWSFTSFSNTTSPPASVFAVPDCCTASRRIQRAVIPPPASQPDLQQAISQHNSARRSYTLSLQSGLASPYKSSLSNIRPSVLSAPVDFLTLQSVNKEELSAAYIQLPRYSVPLAAPPASVDNTAYATPPRNQGNCGSCWAFSSTAAVEVVANYAQNGSSVGYLAPQFLIDCADPFVNKSNAPILTKGCLGGWPVTALSYIADHGVLSEASHPYMAVNGASCPGNGSRYIQGFQVIGATDVTAMMQAVSQYGAVVSIIQVLSDFVFYQGGIYNNSACTGAALSHAITIIGYGTDTATGLDYWLVKNSFGRQWGEGGFFRMARGVDMCGIENWGVVPIPT
jgi:hypothetical protein